MDAALANSLAGVISFILNVIKFLVIVSVIVSWIGDPNNQLVQMVKQIVEPIYRPVRKFTSRIPGPLDWTPLVVLMLVIALERGLVFYLEQYARQQTF